MTEVEKLEARVKALREALEFYVTDFEYDHCEWRNDFKDFVGPMGTTARTALAADDQAKGDR